MCDRSDDPAVLDEELLWRRIAPDSKWVKRLDNGELSTSSMAFIDRRSGDVSVFRAGLTTQADVLRAYPDFGLAEVSVGAVRQCGAVVVADPLPDDDPTSPAHAVFCYPSGAKTKAQRISKLATLIVLPRIPPSAL